MNTSTSQLNVYFSGQLLCHSAEKQKYPHENVQLIVKNR